MAPSRVYRTTLFKIPDPANQKKLVEAYQKLAKDQSKDGKPYILGYVLEGGVYATYITAGQANDDPRAKGYTVVAKTVFASTEDAAFYDEQCPAHSVLKKEAMTLGLAEMPLTVVFQGEPFISE